MLSIGHVAMWHMSNSSWAPLPWKGLNGPVYTITRNIKQNTILFGGQFNATLSDTSDLINNFSTSQPIPMNMPLTSISSGNGAFSSDPKSIVCPIKVSPYSDNQSWLLQDGAPGYWEATFATPIRPTNFRLSNVLASEERGTVSFNILSLGSNEYFNLSYTDPTTHQTVQCSFDCVLSNTSFQDFTVMDLMTTSGIRININSWYGQGGGLGYVQIYQSDISLHPSMFIGNSTCQGISSSSITVTGNWQEVYVYGYYQTVLEAKISTFELDTTNTSILYEPHIPLLGQYNIYATTPGCVGSTNCYQRTQVEYQLQLLPGQSIVVYLDQNVFEDTRTLLYSGLVMPKSNNFRPSITLRPASNATIQGTATIMADNLDLIRNSSTILPIISILEYNLTLAQNTSAVSWKALNEQLPFNSTVYSIDASSGDTIYIGGEFLCLNASGGYRNIVSYDYLSGRMISLNSSGLNGKVSKLISYKESRLFVAGEFNSTAMLNISLPYIVEYDMQQDSWSVLQDGVNGPVNELLLSSTSDTLTLSGNFSCQYLTNKQCIKCGGVAQWSIQSNSWENTSSLIIGDLKAVLSNGSQTVLIGNQLNAETYRADFATLSSSQLIPYTFDDNDTFYPVYITAGTVDNKNSTFVSEHFASDNITRILAFSNNKWVLVDEVQGYVRSMLAINNYLCVGGRFQSNGTTSFSLYDINMNFTKIPIHGIFYNNQPGAINVIKSYPDGKSILVGGSFTRVGSLECDAVCLLDIRTLQWNRVAFGLNGTVCDMLVSNRRDITIFGDFKAHQNNATVFKLNDQANIWSVNTNSLPGIPTSAIVEGDNHTFIVSGYIRGNSSNQFFIGTLQDTTFTPLNDSRLGFDTIINQILLLPASDAIHNYPDGTKDVLLAVGDIHILGIGRVSAALYDGNDWFPYLTSIQWSRRPALIQAVVHKSSFYTPSPPHHYLPVTAVVLISIGISVGILFAMSTAGALYVFKYHGAQDGPEPMPPYDRFLDALGLAAGTSLGVTPAVAAIAGPSNAPEELSNKVVSSEPQTSGAAATSIGIVSFASLAALAKTNTSSIINETRPKLFSAKYPFKAQEHGELDLNEGDQVVVTDTSDNVWWLGYKDDGTGKPISGVFPSNYVKA
ncbi:hypothetical protein RMATCC62417_05336 [Rhizopus microsporus]|nr:hypothetical protein RMATCC62417_05336 [Rhizopus microsporus]